MQTLTESSIPSPSVTFGANDVCLHPLVASMSRGECVSGGVGRRRWSARWQRPRQGQALGFELRAAWDEAVPPQASPG